MERLPKCRICLVENVRMYIVAGRKMHKLYELLTDIPFVTEDTRPMLACYFCYAKLEQCCKLQRQCLKAEKIFAQMMNEPNPVINRGHLQCFNGFVKSPIETTSFVAGVDQMESIAIKEELPELRERLHFTIEPKEEHQSNELELENLHNSCSDIEDMPAQQFESGPGDDLLLMEIKSEVAEEKEESRKRRRSSDTHRSPIAEETKLDIRGRELEDVNTEEQQEKTDTKVTQNTRNCTSKLIPEFREPLTATIPNVNNNYITNTTSDSNGCNNNSENYLKLKILNKEIGSNNINRQPRFCDIENRFKCEICPSTFFKKCHFTQHIRIHDAPLKCEVCRRGFSDKHHLSSHTLLAHRVAGENPHKCDVCQRCFSERLGLIHHYRMSHAAAGEFPHKCGVCQRCFSEEHHLRSHTRIAHTPADEFSHKCDNCQRGFRLKGGLTRHIRSSADCRRRYPEYAYWWT